MTEDTMPRASREIKDTWALEDIYATVEKWEEDYAKAESLVKELPAYEGKLSSRDDCLAASRLYSAVNRLIENLFSYARMRRDEDNSVTRWQALVSRSEGLMMQAGTAGAYMVPELTACPEEYLKGLIEDPDFEPFTVRLTEIIRNKPHTLSGPEERIVAMTAEMGSAASTISPTGMKTMPTEANTSPRIPHTVQP